jgi:hypothetical protein
MNKCPVFGFGPVGCSVMLEFFPYQAAVGEQSEVVQVGA